MLYNNLDGTGWHSAQVKWEVGNVYSRLTVIAPDGIRRVGRKRPLPCAFWLCRCSCGNQVVVCGRNLRSGVSRSCGCLQREHAARIAKQNIGRTMSHKGKPLSATHRRRLSASLTEYFRNKRRKDNTK